MSYLILVRHGQSIWNLENRFTGWVDVDLNQNGIAQAKKAGELDAKRAISEGFAVASQLDVENRSM